MEGGGEYFKITVVDQTVTFSTLLGLKNPMVPGED